tara:strand:+ start:1495 stop:1740 length:246 start_codon:yes stop_codon:yes gene_type:complete
MEKDVKFNDIVQSVYDGICELQSRQEEPTVVLMGEDCYHYMRDQSTFGSTIVGVGMYGELTVFSVPVHVTRLLKNDKVSVR